MPRLDPETHEERPSPPKAVKNPFVETISIKNWTPTDKEEARMDAMMEARLGNGGN